MFPRPPELDALKFRKPSHVRSAAKLVLLAILAPQAGVAAQLALAWYDNSSNETGFKIERATGAGSFVQIAELDSDISSYVDAGVSANATYTYRIRAYNSTGHSIYSNVTTLTVPANTRPTIGTISDRTISEDGTTGALGVTVDDEETSPGSVQLTATSSNTTLVPNGNITLGGSGANRTITVTPAANQSGTTTITVKASDGSLTTTRVFNVTVSAVNDVPTINTIANRTISEDGTTGAIAVTLADVETSAASLQLTATSSNTTLVPSASITLGGSGGSRTITVKPAANQNGIAIITVKASDGSVSGTQTFTVTVSAVNDTPTISNVLDQSRTMGSVPGTIAFTVGDVDTPATSLAVTVTSSSQTVLPNGGMVLGGTGTSRTLTLTPAVGLLGSTTVSIKVSDGTLSATDTFVLKIVASSSNTAPTVSAIADRSIAMNGTTGVIAFTIFDSTTPAASLALTRTSSNLILVPLANITLAGSGAYRTVTVKPVSNLAGAATISIKVSDGTLSRVETFVVNVTSTSNLTYADIGSPALPGSQVISGSTIRMTAGGAAPAATADQFRFGYLSLPGDAELLVRVASLPRAHDWTRGGLMFRASTAANAAHASVFITSNNGVVLQYRSATGASYKSAPSTPGTAPQWLRLTRTADTFYAFTSEDGTVWDLVEFITVDLPSTALGGLAATSQHATTSTIATFDNFIVD